MQVFLIRHPRPQIDLGICYGQLDVDAQEPEAVAARLAPYLPPGIPLFSSPLRRALQLAEALAGATRSGLRIDARLCEINFGEWEGQPWNTIDRGSLDAWAADVVGFTPPGGESITMLQQRVVAFADTLPALGLSQLALVAHAGVLRVLAGHWQRLPTAEWTQLPFDFGSMTVIDVATGTASSP